MPAAGRSAYSKNAVASRWHLGDQEFHLIGENAPITEQQILGPGRGEGHREQRHVRLVGGAVVLATVATAAGGHHVGPDIPALARDGNDMVTGEFAEGEVFATVHAEMTVAMKQGLVGQCRRANAALMTATDGDDRMNVELRENATAAADAAVSGKERIPQCPGNITSDIMGRGFFPGFPGHGTTTDVKAQHEVHRLSVSHRLLEASTKYSMKMC